MTLYSIGYATKPIEVFIAQLQRYGINAVADVRSVPYSKVFHDYHREPLAARLREHAIRYSYLGEELGPRSKNPDHYNTDGQVQFERLQRSALFARGIGRLRDGLDKGYAIALLCAEKDPATCHRSLLIGHYLKRACGIELRHILHDGALEDESSLERRLMQMNDIVPDMLQDESACLDQAWQAQCRQVAYRQPGLQQFQQRIDHDIR